MTQANAGQTPRSKNSPPSTPDPYTHSTTYTSTTPGSEKRQRKTLLIQKQRQQSNYLNLPSPLGHNPNMVVNGHGSFNSMDISMRDVDSSETSTATRASLLNRTPSSRSSSSSSRYPARMRRFVSAMGMAAVFCVFVVLREQRVSENNQLFQTGSGTLKNEETVIIKEGKGSNKNHNPMEALGGIPLGEKGSSSVVEEKKEISFDKPTTAEAAPKEEYLPPDNAPDPKDGGSQSATSASDAAPLMGGGLPLLDNPQEDTYVENDAPKDTPLATTKPQSTKYTAPKPVTYSKTPYDPSMPLQEPQLPSDISNNHSFVKEYCDLQGADWFPINKELARNASHATPSQLRSWRQRAPFALLLGPSHGGSDLLFQLLASHPQMADTLRSQFFTHNFKLYVKQQPAPSTATKTSNTTAMISKVKTRSARQAYMARHITTQRQLQKNPSQVVLDNVRETLLYEQIMAPFVLCAMPWTKWIITVSHPIRRLLSHYHAAKARGLQMTLEEWIATDLERMQQAGLILQPPQNTTAQEFEAQARQTLANHEFWISYQQLTKHSMEASAGQSLYEAMIHPWFTWMERMGRNPSTEIVMVQKELLCENEESLKQEYQRIVKQLGLMPHAPPEALVQSIVAQHRAALERDAEQEEAVRRQLNRFFQPYNHLFDQFLKEYYPEESFRPELWSSH